MPTWLKGLLAGLRAGEKIEDLLAALPAGAREYLDGWWPFAARPDQMPPDGDWLVWLMPILAFLVGALVIFLRLRPRPAAKPVRSSPPPQESQPS